MHEYLFTKLAVLDARFFCSCLVGQTNIPHRRVRLKISRRHDKIKHLSAPEKLVKTALHDTQRCCGYVSRIITRLGVAWAESERITKSPERCGLLLGSIDIRVLDHFVVGGGNDYICSLNEVISNLLRPRRRGNVQRSSV